jgi:hypothetical protein
MAGCRGKQLADELIIVDVTKKYPKKELILQDFMDVEYIALETNDEFVNQGVVMAIGKEIMIVTNVLNDGDIFIYDKNGKALRKINRKGQGGEEYLFLADIILDEDNHEMFVNDRRKIMVYDLFGMYKRRISIQSTNICNFNKESLICNDTSFDRDEEETEKSPFLLISKQDGSIIKEISIVCQQKRPSEKRVQHGDMPVTAFVSNFPFTSIIPYKNNWILTVFSTDTIFNYLPNRGLTPFIVRTPSIQSNYPEAYLYPEILTERYYFLVTEKMEPIVRGTSYANLRVHFPFTNIMYDRLTKEIFEYTVYNGDFSNEKTVFMSQQPINDEIAFKDRIESYELVEAYEKGELKGKLKEIAAGLDAEDNPVIMLVKHKTVRPSYGLI